MKGFLMQRQTVTAGQEIFIESFSPENNYGVVFEDDGETGYFYAVELDPVSKEQRILDALHIYEAEDNNNKEAKPLLIIWSKDWLKCALVIDGICNAIFDFQEQGGYSINEFPPPNEIWTKQPRTLNDDIIIKLF